MRRNNLVKMVVFSSICVGFFSASVNGEPSIQTVVGEFDEGSTLIIKGSGFSEKENDRPYFYWEADEGQSPSPLGRHLTWAEDLNGELSAKVTAPNSSMSFRFDHGSTSAPALAGVTFDSEKLFVFRKTYEDFDTAKDYAIRTRITDLSGSISEGQTVRGLYSGATGVVQSVSEDGVSNRWSVFYNNVDGSINKEVPVDFIYGEPMETDTASFSNTEGSEVYPTGTYRTFNFKTIRLWNKAKGNNAYVGTGRSQKYDVIPEYTDAKLFNKSWDVKLRQRPYEWKSEELYYRASAIGSKNGLVDFRFDNKKSYDHFFQTRSAEKPDMYNIVYQSQVSNGAQPNSFIYYDHLYIDDSWHHVAVCDTATWSNCKDKAIQIPTLWNDTEINVIFDPRHFDKNEALYIYVVDAFGNANANGFSVCPKCPSQPQTFEVN